MDWGSAYSNQQENPDVRKERVRRAAVDLAADMSTQLGVEINPTALEAYIMRRWHVVSPLAHAIHNGA